MIVLAGCGKEGLRKPVMLPNDQAFLITATNGWTGRISYESNKIVVLFAYRDAFPSVWLDLDSSNLYATINSRTSTSEITTVMGPQGIPLYRIISNYQPTDHLWQVYAHGDFVTPEHKNNEWWIGNRKVSMAEIRKEGGHFQ